MKLFASLIFSALIMTFFAARLFFLTNETQTPNKEDIITIREIINNLPSYLEPEEILSYNELFPHLSQEQNNSNIANNLFNQFAGDRNLDYSSDKKCFDNIITLFNSSTSSKFTIWEDFRCNQRSILPKKFFDYGPAVHPAGESYAYLAVKNKKAFINPTNWVKSNLALFLPHEINQLSKMGYSIHGKYKHLANFNKQEFQYFDKMAKIFISADKVFYLIENQNSDPFFQYFKRPSLMIKYYLFSFKKFNSIINNSPFIVSNASEQNKCMYRETNICWNYSFRHILSLTNDTTILFFIFSISSIFLIVGILLKKIKQQKEDDEQKRLALQVLSHEFRTPVSTMLLISEEINKSLNHLPEQLQESFLKMTANAYRLQRLTEKTKNYLHFERKQVINYSKIDSLKDYLLEYVDENPENITLESSNDDTSIHTDQYWLDICLKNLIGNAINHGKPPIKLSFQTVSEYVLISVEDQGSSEFNNINDLTKEFIKGSKSEGSGLGLNIVKKVIKNLGGELSFKTNPTLFTIKLKKG